MYRVGLISDTHGFLDPRVHTLFEQVDAIAHAGDVGSEEILYELQAIAPVTAVAGNMDHPYPTWPLPDFATLEVGGVRIDVVHKRADWDRSRADAADVLVTGHTHEPSVKRRGSLLEVNPGSASRPRNGEGRRTVALLDIEDGIPSVRLVTL